MVITFSTLFSGETPFFFFQSVGQFESLSELNQNEAENSNESSSTDEENSRNEENLPEENEFLPDEQLAELRVAGQKVAVIVL